MDYPNFYTPDSFDSAEDVISLVEYLPTPEDGGYCWILKRQDYIKCVKFNSGSYELLKRGEPDTLLELPIIIDDMVESSGIFVFTHLGHTSWHGYAADILLELITDYYAQNGANNDTNRISFLKAWADKEAQSASGPPTRHKLYPHFSR